jgi:serine/threonine protein phosphatase PrpC
MRQLNIQSSSFTDPGKVWDENQDCAGKFSCPLGGVFIVADGMGGEAGGATAARIAVERTDAYLASVSSKAEPREALKHAASLAHDEIQRAAASGGPETARMGATVVLALVQDSQVIIGHAGDSRAYLFRDGRLSRLTRDHSLVQKMVDHRMLTEEEARVHPDSNVVTRALGVGSTFELEVSDALPVGEGDAILLCSDGLSGEVEDAAIEAMIRRGADTETISRRLVDAALAAGGHDNVTVQFLRFGAEVSVPQTPSGLSSHDAVEGVQHRDGPVTPAPESGIRNQAAIFRVLRNASCFIAAAGVLCWVLSACAWFALKRPRQVSLAEARQMIHQRGKEFIRLAVSLDREQRLYNVPGDEGVMKPGQRFSWILPPGGGYRLDARDLDPADAESLIGTLVSVDSAVREPILVLGCEADVTRLSGGRFVAGKGWKGRILGKIGEGVWVMSEEEPIPEDSVPPGIRKKQTEPEGSDAFNEAIARRGIDQWAGQTTHAGVLYRFRDLRLPSDTCGCTSTFDGLRAYAQHVEPYFNQTASSSPFLEIRVLRAPWAEPDFGAKDWVIVESGLPTQDRSVHTAVDGADSKIWVRTRLDESASPLPSMEVKGVWLPAGAHSFAPGRAGSDQVAVVDADAGAIDRFLQERWEQHWASKGIPAGVILLFGSGAWWLVASILEIAFLRRRRAL